MKSKIIIFGTLSVIIITGVLFYFNRSTTILGNFTRKWKDNPFHDVRVVKTYHNTISIADYHSRVFLNRVYDVIEIDTGGKTKNEYQIKGTKYKMNKNIIGLDVDSTGLYLQDAANGTITKIDYHSNVIYQSKAPGGVFRSVYLDEDQFLIKTGSLKDRYANNFFAVYNPKKESSRNMEGVLPRNGKGGIDTDGSFAKNSTNIFHFYFFMSKVFSFNAKGDPVATFDTIDGDNVPPPVVVTDNGFVSSPEARVIHTAAFADQSNLYMVSAVRSKDMTEDTFGANHVVDVYSLSDHQYIYSFLLPNATGDSINGLSIVGNNLYTITTKNNLVIYKRS